LKVIKKRTPKSDSAKKALRFQNQNQLKSCSVISSSPNARANLGPKLEENTSVLRAEDFPDVGKLPERAVLITPGAPCIMSECTFMPSTLKKAANHSPVNDLAAFYVDTIMDERVAIGITTWLLKGGRLQVWKIKVSLEPIFTLLCPM
jgi:hypothetical protein